MADGVVVVIDADTSRYAAGIQKAAEANKSLVKPIKEHNELWEAGVEVLGRHVMKLTAVGAAVEIVKAGAEAVTEHYDHWIERLEQAKKTMQDMAQSGKGALGGQLAGPGKDREWLAGMDSQLAYPQRAAAYGAYRQANPGSTSDQRKQAVQDASDADVAGLDATQFAGNLGKLRGLGDKAKDITAMAMSRGGDQGGAIVDLLQKITAGHGAAEAEATLPMLMSAANVPGGVSSVAQGYSAYASQGRQGGYANTYKNFGQSLLPNIDEQSTIRAVNAGTKPVQTMGQFQGMVGAGVGDAVNNADVTLKTIKNRREQREYEENISDSMHKEAENYFKDHENKNNAVNMPFTSGILRDLGLYSVYGTDGQKAAATDSDAIDRLGYHFRDAIKEQTEAQRQPANGARNEGAP